MSSSGATVRKYLELVRFSHTIFALPFAALAAVWAMVVGSRSGSSTAASDLLTWKSLLGVLICMVAARSFAMAFNRLVDRDIDAQNPRTKNRHLPSGQLSVTNVTIFAVACAGLFVLGTLLFLPNVLPILLSIPMLLFLAGYSLAKRWTILVHFWLGVALGLAPVCTWLAMRGPQFVANWSDVVPALLLGSGVALWVAGFDLIYACQDSEIDRTLGLKSIPARLSNRTALRIAAVCHALMIVPLLAIPWACPALRLSWWYVAGLALVAMVLLYEHSIVSADDLQRVNIAFFQANAVISILILLVGIADACYG